MTSPSYTFISYEDFPSTLATLTELSSVSLGGKILSCSDEWFAPASDLLKVGPAPSMKGQFGPKGALFDGWETRRHNPTYDWVILRLGPKAGGFVSGFDIDTANFNGNEAPEIQVFGLSLSAEEEKLGKNLEESDERWAPLLPRLPCNPSARHLYSLNSPFSTPTTHIKLLMIPDGGIARFRVYGTVPPPPVGLGVSEQQTSPDDKLNILDLAHVMNGGRVVFTSDQHFGVGANLILPGRGKDMGDGWETKRSRAKGHKDWVVIKLGEPGFLSYVEVDTAHFLGNFPESCELHATNFDGQLPSDNADWTPILSRSKLGPGKQHFFKLENETKSFSHVKLTMHPDGGIKRIRLVGRRAAPLANHSGNLPPIDVPGSSNKALPVEPSAFQAVTGAASAAFSSLLGSSSTSVGVTHVAQPLSSESFAPYGQVIASPSDPSAPFKTVNLGTAKKYSNLAISRNLFKPEDNAKTNLHVYKCQGIGKSGLPFHVRMLERHRFSDQAFIPMTSSKNLGQEGYLVVVAKNGLDDKPDLGSLAAFYCNSEQAISYSAGTWHHPMIALGSAETDFTVIVADSESNESLNCDEAHWETDVAIVGL